MGEYQESQIYYNEAVSILEQKGLMPSLLNMCKVGLARAMIMQDDKGINLELVYAYHDKNNYRFMEGYIPRYIGEILLNVDNQHVSEAEEWVRKAIEADTRNDMRWNLGRDYALYAELFKRKDDQPKARENLGKAIEILRECGADGWVEKYEKELASVS